MNREQELKLIEEVYERDRKQIQWEYMMHYAEVASGHVYKIKGLQYDVEILQEYQLKLRKQVVELQKELKELKELKKEKRKC